MSAIKPRGKLSTEEEDGLKEMCLSNGLNYLEVRENKGVSVTCLEFLFNNFTRLHLNLLNYFQYITHLMIIGQPIHQIEGISNLPNLIELWIVECKLKSIDGLEKSNALQKLFLHCNQISRIENLDLCPKISTLWLASNNITKLDNLDQLYCLKDLNIADNKIKTIGNSLSRNVSLYRINLSGNPINTFKELIQLSLLPNLKELYLEDPKYLACPVTLLCNYSFQMLHLFQKLNRLDCIDLSNSSLVENVQSIIYQKMLFYRSQIQLIKNEFIEKLNYIQRLRARLCQPLKDRIRTLCLCSQQIELLMGNENRRSLLELHQDKVADPSKNLNDQLKVKTVQQRIDILKSKLLDYEKKYIEALTKCNCDAAFKIGKQRVEFRSYGNVYFETGNKADKWVTACKDLVMARFCEHDYQKVGIKGVKVIDCIRIHNKMFDLLTDNLDQDLQESKLDKPEKVKPEYLFFTSASDVGSVIDVAENGCFGATPTEVTELAVPLTNSLFQADRGRIEKELGRYSKKPSIKGLPHRFAYIVLCKAYHRPCVQIPIGTKISPKAYPHAKSVSHLTTRPQSPSRGSNLVPRCYSAVPRRSQSPIPSNCDCNMPFNMYQLFDSQRVIPQYIIHVEYQTKMASSSPFLLSRRHSRSSSECRIPIKIENDQDMVNFDSHHLKQLDLINEFDVSNEEKVEKLENLCIVGRKGFSLLGINLYSSLTSLTLSFIEISNLSLLPELPYLDYLDLSFNKIKTIEDMKSYSKLSILDLSWNELNNIQATLITLAHQVPELRNLDVRQNPWNKEHLRFRELITSCLRLLTTLNGTQVSESTMYSAMSIPLPLILTHSYAIPSKLLYTLGLCFSNEYMSEWGITRTLSRSAATSASAFSQITVLDLSRQNLLNLVHIEKLVNLKSADFSHNYLHDITGLEKCLNLEELSIENNCVCRLDPSLFDCMKKLRVLDVSNNLLSSLQLFCQGKHILPNLNCLIASGNQIQNINDLKMLNTLRELYLSQNNICSIQSINNIRNLENLEVLDLVGNIVTKEFFYRLYIIFNAASISYVDGIFVEDCEVIAANDKFGGFLDLTTISSYVGHNKFEDITQLDLPNCSLKNIDWRISKNLCNLKCLNLENNNLTSLNGLCDLPNLSTLCLNYNKIKCILPENRTSELIDDDSSWFGNLDVLLLGYNEISDLGLLNLSLVPNLKALFLQGNFIMNLDGLDGPKGLEYLILDRNKIKDIDSDVFRVFPDLKELHIEENRVKELCNLGFLKKLIRLFLGFNRIQEIEELEKLFGLNSLEELTMVANPVCRKYLHRPTLISQLPKLITMDGINITSEERFPAEERKNIDGFKSNNNYSPTAGASFQPWILDYNISQISPDKNNSFKGSWNAP